MVYKFVKINPILDTNPSFEIESLLSQHTKEGWEFYCFAPQQDNNGTYSNTAIFMKE